MRKKSLLGGLTAFLVLVSVVVALALPNLATAGFQYVAGQDLNSQTLVRDKKLNSTQGK
jgi:hypothetical protein